MTKQADDQSPERLSNGMLYLIIGGCAAVGAGLVALASGDILGEFGRDRLGEAASRSISFMVGGAGGALVGAIISSVIWHAKK